MSEIFSHKIKTSKPNLIKLLECQIAVISRRTITNHHHYREPRITQIGPQTPASSMYLYLHKQKDTDLFENLFSLESWLKYCIK